MSPQLFRNKDIDKVQWNNCIARSVNGLIYAQTFYLDHMCPGWHGLVGGAYDWVMPITHNTKYGIRYLYQPAFTQQLGVFYIENVHPPYEEIINWLQRHYPYAQVQWNSANPIPATSTTQVSVGTNFIIDLSAGHEAISNNYHQDLKNNIKKARKQNVTYCASNDFAACINWYKNYYGNRMPHIREIHYHRFQLLANEALNQQKLLCRLALLPDGEIAAAALLVFDGRRMYNLMNTTHTAGRKAGANHFLIDEVLKEFAGSDIIFDFEGSDLPGVKDFYQNFGAINQPYYHIRYNLLPWPIRLLKQ